MTNNPKNQLATKRDLKGFRDDVKNYMGLLHEQLSDQVKVVAEQYTGIDKRLAKVESKTDMLVDKTDMLVDKTDMLVGKTDMLEKKTNMLIETVADIKEDTTLIKEELGNKVNRGEHRKLERRVTVLEAKI